MTIITRKVVIMSPSGIRDHSTKYWQVYGIRARLTVTNLTSAIEHIRALAGKMQVNHKITIVSPKGSVWVIPADTPIEKSNAKKIN